MKIPKLKSILLTITFSLLLFSNCYSQDLLDAIKNNSKLVMELKDAFRAFHVNNIIIDQKEMINIVLDDASDTEIKTLLNGYIKTCDSLKIVRFKNDTLNSYVSKYLALTVQSYKVAQSKGFNSAEFKKDFEKYKKEKGKYMDYLYSTYSTNHFIGMTEENYWQTNDKKNTSSHQNMQHTKV